MKTITKFLALGLIGAIAAPGAAWASTDAIAQPPAPVETPPPPTTEEGKNLSGDYLSSLFAQRHHDWKKAGEYLNSVMKQTPDEPSLSKRAMALAMGSGDFDTAFALAKKVAVTEKDGSLAHLFLAVKAFHDKDYKTASEEVKAMPEGSLSDFIMPLLNSWAQAAVGVLDIDKLDKNTIHIHHAALIADFLKQKIDLEDILDKAVEEQEVTLEDVERIANLYAHIDDSQKAIELYEKILEQWPDHPTAAQKIAVLKEGKKLETLVPVKSPEQGVAAALYDMANLLFREYADDSARVFAQMAIYLMPSMTDGRLLLAAIDARNERYAEAIASYKTIPPDNEYYVEARRRAADLMEENGDAEGALSELNTLAKDHNDVESLIKVGDIYRRQENFPKAIETYNAAAATFKDGIPKEYWNLLYVRGMSYERAGQWDKAEADLKAALAFEPDQPFVMNYLGYAWADQGMHLQEALELIRKAAAQPNDGYIVDSLGWALFRTGHYDESLKNMEKAIELLPYDAVVNDHLGDLYWRTGRKREARFQWQRSVNYSTDQTFIAKENDKIQNGLPVLGTAEPVKDAPADAQDAAPEPKEEHSQTDAPVPARATTTP